MSDNNQPEAPATVHRHPTTRDELQAAVVDLIASARRELLICSPALDPSLYNRVALSEALGHFIALHARSRARILVEDSEYMLLSSVRLVELARRFSDKILIQRLGEPYLGLTEMFIVADSDNCFIQPDINSINATFDLNAPHLAVPLVRRFESMWAASEPVPGLHNFRL